MGLPMARNLLRGGHALNVHTRTPDRASELLTAGARWFPSPGAAALESDLVITMLPDSQDVRDAAYGEDGVLAGAHDRLTWIDMSSIDPSVTREVVEKARKVGLDCLDAPVSGGEQGAIDAKLSIMVGGAKPVFDRWLPVLELLGSSITYVGDTGSGQIAKLCNQVVVGCTIAAVAEALVLAERSGADPALVRGVMLGGFAQSRVLEVHGERMLEGQFAPGFRTALHLKDLRNAIASARIADAKMPLTSEVSRLMKAQVANGDGNLDHAALVRVYESMAGIEAA
jgi:2-hydroxy-3-oxopropionate reductase